MRERRLIIGRSRKGRSVKHRQGVVLRLEPGVDTHRTASSDRAATACSGACERCADEERGSRGNGHPPPPQMAAVDRVLVDLVHAARSGDDVAWGRLVGRFDRRLRAIAGSYRLPPVDVDDVIQATWLRLFKHIERLREPAALAGWLATTTRRESVRLLALRSREQLSDDPELGDRPERYCPAAELLAEECRQALQRALTALPERHRMLMGVLITDADPDYRQIGARLAIPVGSIGPIRGRSLARLRRDPQLRALCGAAGQPSGVSGAPFVRSCL